MGVGLLALTLAGQSLSPDEVRITSRPYEPQSQVLRAESRLVRIDAVVRDSNGRIVSGLKPEDFAILDDGRKQTIATFAVEAHEPLAAGQLPATPPASLAAGPTEGASTAPLHANGTTEPQPRYVALYFDDLHTKPGDMNHVRVAAENFVRRGLSTNDQVALFTASSTVSTDFTTDVSKVLDALANLKSRARLFDSGVCPRITPQDAFMIANFPNSDAYKTARVAADQCNCDDQANSSLTCYKQQEQMVLAQAQQIWEPMKELSKNTLETIQGVVDYLAKEPGARVLVLASSGFLTGTLEAQVDLLMDDALRAGIVINALDAKGLYTEDPSHGRMQNELHGAAAALTAVHEAESFGSDLMSMTAAMADFAVGTGGRFFHNRNDLTAGYYSLAAAPETEYLIGFAPEREKLNGSFHKLKVEVTMPGKFDVQARPGYFAVRKESRETSGPTPEEKIDVVMGGSDEKSDLSATVSDSLATAKSGRSELTVQTRVDIQKLPFERQEDRHVEKLTFVDALYDPQGKLVTGKVAVMDLALKPESYERFAKTGISGTMTLEVPAGTYRLRVVVQEGVHGAMTLTTKTVQIQ